MPIVVLTGPQNVCTGSSCLVFLAVPSLMKNKWITSIVINQTIAGAIFGLQQMAKTK